MERGRLLSISLALTVGIAGAALLLAQEQPAPTEGSFTAQLAWGDFDQDGLDDALAYGSAGPPSLLRNRGDGTFEDVTIAVGLARCGGLTQADWRDLNGDGAQDLFAIGSDGRVHIFRNDASGSMYEVTSTSGIQSALPATGGQLLDFDHDDRADLLLSRGGKWELFHNEGASFARVDLGLSLIHI